MKFYRVPEEQNVTCLDHALERLPIPDSSVSVCISAYLMAGKNLNQFSSANQL
jgi:hypothetical protein